MDFWIQGNSATGSLEKSGAHADLMLVDDVTYVKTNQAGWQALGVPAEVSSQYAGKWVRAAGASGPTEGLTIASLVDQIAKDQGGWLPTVEQTTLNGSKVVIVTKTNGDKLYVANTGEALPLRFGSVASGVVDLSEFGTDFRITAPPDAVEMTQP